MTATVDLTQSVVGLSLRLCVRDVIEGRINVEQVEAIVSATKITTDADLEEVMETYVLRGHWVSDPVRAKRIARALWARRAIIQPRLNGVPRHGLPRNGRVEDRWANTMADALKRAAAD